jgi:hypothetical protein
MSLSFNGSSQAVQIAAGRPFHKNVAAGTLMAWVKQAAFTGTSMAIVGFFGGLATTRAKITLIGAPANAIQIRARSLDTDAGSNVQTVTPVVVGELTHIAAVIHYNQRTGIIYINGAANVIGIFSTMTASNTSNTNNTNGFFGSGETGTADEYNGLLEDVRIYDRALSEDEIATIVATQGKDGIWSGLQGRWPCMDRPPGVAASGAVQDISLNSFGGIPQNAPPFQEILTAPPQIRPTIGSAWR